MFNIKRKIKYLLLKKSMMSKYENTAYSKMPLSLVLTNKRGQILFANEQAYKTFKNLRQAKKINSVFSEITHEFLNDNKNSQNEFCLKNSWFRITKIYDGKRILLYFQDFSKDKLNEENRKTFIISLTHDLKTPINAQIRALDLLLNGTFGILSDEQTDIVREIKKSCNYMYNLIFNIVDTYLFDKGEKKLQREKFDWVQLVQETMHELSYLTEEKQQKIEIKSKVETSEMYADKFQMKRAVTNLISNAITHSNPHSNIEVTMKENKENVCFDIKSEPIIALPKTLDNIFNKFQTNLSSGSGLGLYIVKQIISSEGGKVHATTTLDGNCIFGFETPKKLNNPVSNYLKK